jgi:hypothetical protein
MGYDGPTPIPHTAQKGELIMEKKRFRFQLVLISFFIISCAPSIKIVSDFSDPSYSVGQVSAQSKVKLFMASAVSVLEFNKSFDKEYHSAEEFVPVVQKQIADSMKSILGCAVALNENAQDAVSLSVTQTPAEMEVLFGSAADDFFFVIKAMEISSKKSAPVMMAGGGMKPGAEICVVTMKAELWSAKDKKRLLAYDAIGEAKVSMMFYGTALKAAVGKAIGNMVGYVKTGRTM